MAGAEDKKYEHPCSPWKAVSSMHHNIQPMEKLSLGCIPNIHKKWSLPDCTRTSFWQDKWIKEGASKKDLFFLQFCFVITTGWLWQILLGNLANNWLEICNWEGQSEMSKWKRLSHCCSYYSRLYCIKLKKTRDHGPSKSLILPQWPLFSNQAACFPSHENWKSVALCQRCVPSYGKLHGENWIC